MKLQNITKIFGKTLAVDDVSLEIENGEFLTLLGPSGCGKTTILRIIAGLENVTSGVVQLEDVDITNLNPTKRDISIMFQDYALFPHMTIIENVSYGLRMRGVGKTEREKQAAKWLETMQLSNTRNRFPSELSGGQRQRVALARALITNPKILLLDEPLSALDANLRIRLREELRKIHRQIGTTFICVTHDQEEAMALSDRIAILKDGQIEQIGTPNELYDKPASEFVANFFGKCALWPIIKSKKETEKSLLEHTNLPCKTAIMPDSNTARAVIRPEFLEIAEQQITSKNQLKAKVLDILTKGTSNLITVEFENGLLLDIDVPRKYVLPDLSEHVYIKLTQNELHIIND
jgi:ABC-type Fe3+/spermidine/putrescine transport system ATPase subunit